MSLPGDGGDGDRAPASRAYAEACADPAMASPEIASTIGTRVFASFDAVHDGDLYARLLAESGDASLGITVSGGSEPFSATTDWIERTRSRIRDAEWVLVICGELTDASGGVAAELRIAREERKPHLLLWGRRNRMCTKPAGSTGSEAIYTWTPPTLHEQLAMMRRAEWREAAASGMRRGPSGQPHADEPAS